MSVHDCLQPEGASHDRSHEPRSMNARSWNHPRVNTIAPGACMVEDTPLDRTQALRSLAHHMSEVDIRVGRSEQVLEDKRPSRVACTS